MNDNRYAAPASVVADVDEPAIAARPRNVVIGVYLLWIELAIGIPGMVYQLLNPAKEIPEGPVKSVLIVFTALVLVSSAALYALLNWKSWQGRHWARVVHLVFLCLGLVIALWTLPATFVRSTLQGVVYIVQTALNIPGVILLFTPTANAWYKALREVRR